MQRSGLREPGAGHQRRCAAASSPSKIRWAQIVRTTATMASRALRHRREEIAHEKLCRHRHKIHKLANLKAPLREACASRYGARLSPYSLCPRRPGGPRRVRCVREEVSDPLSGGRKVTRGSRLRDVPVLRLLARHVEVAAPTNTLENVNREFRRRTKPYIIRHRGRRVDQALRAGQIQLRKIDDVSSYPRSSPGNGRKSREKVEGRILDSTCVSLSQVALRSWLRHGSSVDAENSNG